MLKVGVATSRWLGARIIEYLATQPCDLVGVAWMDRAKPYPGDPDAASVLSLLDRAGTSRCDPEAFRDLQPDIVISALTGYIFREADLDAYRCLNLHPAPLPAYRGCNSYAHAIEAGDPYYAVTLHWVDTGIDTGPVVAQSWLPINEDETGWSLYRRSQCTALELFRATWPGLSQALLLGVPPQGLRQDEAAARYFRREVVTAPEERTTDASRRAWTFPVYA